MDSLLQYQSSLSKGGEVQGELRKKDELKEKALETFQGVGDALAVDSGEGLGKVAVAKTQNFLKKRGGVVGGAVSRMVENGKKQGFKGVLSQGLKEGQNLIGSATKKATQEGARIVGKKQSILKDVVAKASKIETSSTNLKRSVGRTGIGQMTETRRPRSKLEATGTKLLSGQIRVKSGERGNLGDEPDLFTLLSHGLPADHKEAVNPFSQGKSGVKPTAIQAQAKEETKTTAEGKALAEAPTKPQLIEAKPPPIVKVLPTEEEENLSNQVRGKVGSIASGALGQLGTGLTIGQDLANKGASTKQKVEGVGTAIGGALAGEFDSRLGDAVDVSQSVLQKGVSKQQKTKNITRGLAQTGKDVADEEGLLGGPEDPLADIAGLAIGLGGMLSSVFHKPKQAKPSFVNTSYQPGLGQSIS